MDQPTTDENEATEARESLSSMKMLGHMLMAAITVALLVCGTLLAMIYWH